MKPSPYAPYTTASGLGNHCSYTKISGPERFPSTRSTATSSYAVSHTTKASYPRGPHASRRRSRARTTRAPDTAPSRIIDKTPPPLSPYSGTTTKPTQAVQRLFRISGRIQGAFARTYQGGRLAPCEYQLAIFDYPMLGPTVGKTLVPPGALVAKTCLS